MAKKPANLIYGLEEKPPFLVGLLLGLQHVSVIFISVSFPVLVVGYLGDAIDERSAQGFVSLTLLATGIVTVLQSLKGRPVGSGHLIPAVCGPSYLAASIMAVTAGGLPLLFGMTAFVGVIEIAFSRVLHRLRCSRMQQGQPLDAAGPALENGVFSVLKFNGVNFFVFENRRGFRWNAGMASGIHL